MIPIRSRLCFCSGGLLVARAAPERSIVDSRHGLPDECDSRTTSSWILGPSADKMSRSVLHARLPHGRRHCGVVRRTQPDSPGSSRVSRGFCASLRLWFNGTFGVQR